MDEKRTAQVQECIENILKIACGFHCIIIKKMFTMWSHKKNENVRSEREKIMTCMNDPMHKFHI